MRKCRVGRHVPRSGNRVRVLDFMAGVSAVLTSPGARIAEICAATLWWTIVVLRDGDVSLVARGCSAVGSASPCQGEGRGFESRHPLEGAVASTPAVEWPSGEATACKAVHTGSIPVSTSKGFRRD